MQVVPSCTDKQLSKYDTVQMAYTYMQTLMDILEKWPE